ncbi:hypothetical protein QUF58_14480 [Anaerolineales bacterium HSG24]|nr:hypothetical protein [Anaerolineales bacterium HSG24]
MQKLNDSELLQRFEPIIHFTKGEQFFPMDVEPYVKECSLWVQRPNQEPICLVPDGQLTMEGLVDAYLYGPDAVYFLRFIEDHDLYKLDVHAFSGNSARKKGFRPGRGRLARVGYSARFIDVIFAITLFARGRVPGDTAIGAYLEYERIMTNHEHYGYHGRVVRKDGWIVLQYWFFYAFNSWRSGFFGVNDHESDWEMICIYLYETSLGDVQPEWVAYASHDYHGDDLRRRWDDPEVTKDGEHPVIYAGAGSHASYFHQGEYMTEVVLPFLTPLVRLIDQQQRFWRRLLKQYRPEELQYVERPTFNLFRVPFVDYARGDGLSIGPGQEKKWEPPRILNPTPDWVKHYRGLWGLYTKDPVSGEDAPGGPMYNRDGSVRVAWYDPVSWAGLSKVPPPNQMITRIQEQRDKLLAKQTELKATITQTRDTLTGLRVEADTMFGAPHLKKRYDEHEEQIAQLSTELVDLRGQLTANDIVLTSMNAHIERLKAGDRGPMRAHIRHAQTPMSEVELRYGRVAEIWASVSIGLLMIAFVILIFFAPQRIGFGMAILILAMVFLEAAFRKQLQLLITSLTNLLAIVASLVLLFHFSLQIMAVAVFLMGSYIMWQNMREFLQ